MDFLMNKCVGHPFLPELTSHFSLAFGSTVDTAKAMYMYKAEYPKPNNYYQITRNPSENKKKLEQIVSIWKKYDIGKLLP